jgi:endonuclease/exonuclease/phosphatase family metal-dependent hydrolase
MAMSSKDAARQIDLEQAARLIHELERDLAKVQGGAEDVQRLRDEVETLRNVLNSPVQRHHWVSDSLHDIRSLLDETVDEAIYEGTTISRYAADIARILGL